MGDHEQTPLHLKLALTPEQVDELTGVAARTVRDLVKAGHLARVPHTSRILIARAEVDRWLAGGQQQGSAA